MNHFVQIILFSTLYALFNSLGAGMIKNELKTSVLVSVSDYVYFLFKIKVIVSFTIILFSALMMFKALSLGKFSIISPIATGINFFVTILLGYFFFKDNLTIFHLMGLFLIFMGIFVISFAENTIK